MKRPTSEEAFYERVYRLVNNLIVTNSNNSNSYFHESSKVQFAEDVKERGQYILDELETMKHMIVDE
jgi:hypothetical protein